MESLLLSRRALSSPTTCRFIPALLRPVCPRLPLICDFCGADAPGWYYPAGTFDGPDRTRSMGDLLACDECHRLIEAGWITIS
jgi:hypothetical protein